MTASLRHWTLLISSSLRLSFGAAYVPPKTVRLKRRQFLSRPSILSHVHITNTQSPRGSSVVYPSDSPSQNENEKENQVFEQLKQLVLLIQHHDRLYYTPGLVPQLSDDQYDALTRQEDQTLQSYPHLLARLLKDPDIIANATPHGIRWSTARLRATHTEDLYNPQKVVHLAHAPMQSLDNAMNIHEVVQWLNRIRKKLFDAQVHSSFADLHLRAEPKLDGLSMSLRYQQKQNNDSNQYTLIWGATRGDGQRGEDVTDAVMPMTYHQVKDHQVKDITILGKIPLSFSLPKTWPTPFPQYVEVRGEVILPTSVLNQPLGLNRTFSNTRNAASGLLLRYKNQTTAETEETFRLRSYLRFYAYALECSDTNTHLSIDIYPILMEMGFTIPTPHQNITLPMHPHRLIQEQDCDALVQYHNHLSILFSKQTSSSQQNHTQELDIDGAVYKVTNPVYRTMLGSSSRAPRWAIAHKYPASSAVTTLLRVETQIGRTGVLTPVAILSPVNIRGVEIRRASLHNFKKAQSVLKPNRQGQVPQGISVLVGRAGDVIPQIIQRVGGEILPPTTSISDNHWISLNPPSSCPSCGSRTIIESIHPFTDKRDANEDDDEEATGPVVRCGGSVYTCTPRTVSALTHAFSRSGLNIQGISEARIRSWVQLKLVRYPVDVFEILDSSSTFSTTLVKMDGWGKKSVQNLAREVATVKINGITLSQFINSLGIHHVGLSSSKLIAEAFGSVDNFLFSLEDENKMEQTLAPIQGLGPKTISSMVSYAQDNELVKAAVKLADCIRIRDVSSQSTLVQFQEQQLPPLQGKNVVFTGSLGPMMTRAKAQGLAVSVLGAQSVSNSISKSTNVLIVGEKGGGKEKKAMDMNIQIVNAEEFFRWIQEWSVRSNNN